jgi:hypothetical protein
MMLKVKVRLSPGCAAHKQGKPVNCSSDSPALSRNGKVIFRQARIPAFAWLAFSLAAREAGLLANPISQQNPSRPFWGGFRQKGLLSQREAFYLNLNSE